MYYAADKYNLIELGINQKKKKKKQKNIVEIMRASGGGKMRGKTSHEY